MPATLIVVGLGSGDADQLTLGIWKRLQPAPGRRICLRTERHPVVDMLRDHGIGYESFDAVYERHDQFNEVYEAIAGLLTDYALSAGDRDEIVYAVPGHPMVAEYTVQLLKRRCPELGIDLHVLGGESFLDQAFLRLGFDPVEGFQLLDGTMLDTAALHYGMHAIVTQVYDVMVASDVKLKLMTMYPDEYPVVAAHNLGVAGQERIDKVPLYELDRLDGYGNLSLVWIPRTDQQQVQNRWFSRLHEIVAILRSPEGCPWDREQTHASIRKHLIEETYEVLETIDDDDPDAMCEELGDLLLQVMLHAQMEEETGAFTVYDVIAGLNEKLLRRHPHVFGDTAAGDAEEALANWNAIKKEEKRQKGIDVEQASALDGVPRDLPGVLKAAQLQKKASRVGFDWERIEDVFTKVEEELAELREAAADNGDDAMSARKEELGDLLFAVVNLSRFLDADPEGALAHANRKFASRFAYIERQLRQEGRDVDEADLQEMEKLWQQSKIIEKS